MDGALSLTNVSISVLSGLKHTQAIVSHETELGWSVGLHASSQCLPLETLGTNE